jgi:hypothetical protein
MSDTAELRVVYLEFGASRPAVAWHAGRMLGPHERDERALIHRRLSIIVDRASYDATAGYGRAVRSGRTLLVEVPIGLRGDRGEPLIVTAVVKSVGGTDWAARCAADVVRVLREADLNVDPAPIRHAMARGWRGSDPFGVRGLWRAVRCALRWLVSRGGRPAPSVPTAAPEHR